MATVYIVSNAGHDYSTAQRFGEIKFLCGDKVNVFAADRLVKDLHEQLKDSTPNDYLLPSGNSLATCAAFAILMGKHGSVNHMIYSFRNKMYEVRTISIRQIQAKEVLE